MKILACSLTYPLPNGVTISLDTSADGFILKGHDFRIVAPRYALAKVREEHYPAPYSVLTRVFLSFFGKEERTFGIKAKSYIDRIVKDFQPDAYWLHTLSPAPNAFEEYIIKSKKPKVLTYHTFVEKYGRLYLGKAGAKIMINRSRAVANKMDAIIVPSNATAEKLREYKVKTPISIIHTGVDIARKPFSKKEIALKQGFSPKEKILLFVGRVSREKNIEFLISAMAELKKSGFKGILLIIGPGDIPEMKRKAKASGVEKQVVFTGSLKKEETLGYYGSADAFVFASQTETQGLVISEAMMAGLPVVALDSPIQKEVYPEGTALIVYDKTKFSRAVLDLFNKPFLKSRLVKNGKKFALKEFSKEKMITRQIALFERLINGSF